MSCSELCIDGCSKMGVKQLFNIWPSNEQQAGFKCRPMQFLSKHDITVRSFSLMVISDTSEARSLLSNIFAKKYITKQSSSWYYGMWQVFQSNCIRESSTLRNGFLHISLRVGAAEVLMVKGWSSCPLWQTDHLSERQVCIRYKLMPYIKHM